MRSTRRDVGPNSVLGRAFALLGAFDVDHTHEGDSENEDAGLTLAEMSRRTGISRSTAHRLLGELIELRVVERAADGYRLGTALYELGLRAPRQRWLRQAAAPHLTGLSELTNQTVHLAVLDGSDVLYVDKIERPTGLKVGSRPGGRMSAHCTGIGRAMLAFAPPDRLTAVLAGRLRRWTPRTVVAPGLIEREIHRVRERGVAVEWEESRFGVACVAAPVLGSDGMAVAAVSVTGSSRYLNAQRLAPIVSAAAVKIEASLQGSAV